MAESGNAVSLRDSSRAGTWFPRLWRYRSPDAKCLRPCAENVRFDVDS